MNQATDGWTVTQASSLCLKIGSGATPRGGSDVYLDKGEYSLIRSQNVYNGGFSYNGLAYISQNHARELNNVEVYPEDVLINITGDSVARSCMVPIAVLPARVNQHVAIIRSNPKKLVPKFLRYFLIQPSIQSHLLSMAGCGGTRAALTKAMLEKIPIHMPENIEEQRAIAAVLSALDDKIELNRQINKTLEEMAQAIFKEWFVDFGPFRDGGMQDSELGLIPAGWQVGRFTGIANILSGGTPKTSVHEYWNGEIPFFSPKDASDSYYVLDTEKHVTVDGLRNCNSKLYDPDTIFISARGTVGKVALAGYPMAMNQSCYALRGKSGVNQYYLFFQTLLAVEQLKKNASGAVFDAIVVSTFDSIPVVIPPVDCIEKFRIVVSSLMGMLFNNQCENNTLAAIRDTLLPKLMSGEIRVPVTEESA